MSRQVRTQMPQTQKKDKKSKSKGKKFDKNACLLMFILLFSGILIFLLLTASDNKKLTLQKPGLKGMRTIIRMTR